MLSRNVGCKFDVTPITVITLIAMVILSILCVKAWFVPWLTLGVLLACDQGVKYFKKSTGKEGDEPTIWLSADIAVNVVPPVSMGDAASAEEGGDGDGDEDE